MNPSTSFVLVDVVDVLHKSFFADGVGQIAWSCSETPRPCTPSPYWLDVRAARAVIPLPE